MTIDSNGQRYLFLDGLRGIAALAIVIHHFTQHSVGHRAVFSSAAIAVELFFCLSGFVIAHSYHQRLIDGMPLATYARKRLSRLYPMYAVGLMLGLAAMAMLKANGLTDFTWSAIGKAAGLNLFYLPYLNEYEVQIFIDRIPGAVFPLNSPAWSLFFGLFANMFYALSIRVWRGMPLLLVAVSGMALYHVTAIMGEAPGWGSENFMGGFPRVFFSFFAGVAIFQCRAYLDFLPRIPPFWLVALVVLILAAPRFAGHKIYWFANAVIFMPLVVACGARCMLETGGRWHRLCARGGEVSYPLYCVHFPLLMMISIYFSTEGNIVPLMTCSVLLALTVAAVLMKYAETPARAWLARRASAALAAR